MATNKKPVWGFLEFAFIGALFFGGLAYLGYAYGWRLPAGLFITLWGYSRSKITGSMI